MRGSTWGIKHFPSRRCELVSLNVRIVPYFSLILTPYLFMKFRQWGLIPHWSKHPPSAPLNTINARSENLMYVRGSSTVASLSTLICRYRLVAIMLGECGSP